MKDKSPTLSIVMPFFNQKDMVEHMIDSILANDYHDWELIAIDDGSEADVADYLTQRFKNDKRIKLIPRDREPKGAQTCRNMGMEMARGEFIVFFDSDDYVTTTCLRNRVLAMQQHPEHDFIVFRSGIFHDGQFSAKPTALTFGYPIYKDDVEAFCSRFLPFVVWNNIYRRESLKKHHVEWDTQLLSLQDSMFNLQCLLSGMSYTYNKVEPDYGYRLDTPGSISKKLKSTAHLQSHLYITEQFFTKVQQQYGHRYDHALYRGALQVMLQVARSNGFYPDFNLAMADTVRKHTPYWGRLLRFQVKLFHALRHCLSDNLSRQISFLGYLIWSKRKEQWKVKAEEKLV